MKRHFLPRPVFLLLFMLLLCSSVLAEMPEAEEPAATPVPVYTLLKSGSKGEDVIRLQQRLIDLGYLEGPADGDFGKATRNAVRLFQKNAGLDVDGLAGKDTQTLLFSEDAPHAPEPKPPADVLEGEFPMLVNAEHPVEEDFVPADLVLLTDLCDPSLVKIKYAKTQGNRMATEALVTMLTAAKADGLRKWQVSAGYRSYSDQETLLNNKINSYLNKNPAWSRSRARSAALRTVAEPGSSEHHTGLAFDVNVPGTSSFLGTKQCTWLHEHCWEYGFIIRYPSGKEDITGFSAEPWHIRYVGTEHSMLMKESGICLEEYLDHGTDILLEEVELE